MLEFIFTTPLPEFPQDDDMEEECDITDEIHIIGKLWVVVDRASTPNFNVFTSECGRNIVCKNGDKVIIRFLHLGTEHAVMDANLSYVGKDFIKLDHIQGNIEISTNTDGEIELLASIATPIIFKHNRWQ